MTENNVQQTSATHGLCLVRPRVAPPSSHYEFLMITGRALTRTMIRVRAGISYALSEMMDEGHCGLPRDELEKLAETLLEVPGDLVRAALNLELTDGSVIADSVA